MINFLSVLAAILVIAIIILIHEAGHFAVARWMKIPVKEFAIGFGPKLLSWERNSVIYSLRWIPLGGYVRFYGEENDDDEFAYANYNVYKRIFVTVAGVLANLISAAIISIVVLMTYGAVSGAYSSIAAVEEGSPADLAGLMAGDRFVTVDSRPVQTGQDVIDLISPARNQSVQVVMERDGESREFTLTPIFDEAEQRSMVGIQISTNYIRSPLPFLQAVPVSVGYVYELVSQTLFAIKDMIFGGAAQGELMGIVGTVTVVSEGIRQGFEMLLLFAVIISVNVALINILPLPAVDGGKLIFLALEAIRGRPIDPNKEGMVHFAGIVLFFGLAVLLTYKDIMRLITGG
ncbi:MAG: M50 family metallopeptidase [Christensenellales bacterium]|jgi:regulator of sigma E protease